MDFLKMMKNRALDILEKQIATIAEEALTERQDERNTVRDNK